MDTRDPLACPTAINAIIAAVPVGTWLYYGFVELLFYPFRETRSIGDLLAFHSEKRRDGMLTYVIDLYSPGLTSCTNAVILTDSLLDGAGYFALSRVGLDGLPANHQLDFHGGLRSRFEDHIPPWQPPDRPHPAFPHHPVPVP